MSSKLLCLVFLLSLNACDEKNNASTSLPDKCEPDILLPEIETLKAKLNCSKPVKKSGTVILSFYIDENGAPQKIRNNLASAKMPDNLQCAIDHFKEFRSKTLKNCTGDATFVFTKRSSKYETSRMELKAIIQEGTERKHLDLFQNFYQEFGEMAVAENLGIIVPFTKVLPNPENRTTALKIMQKVEQLFAPLKKEACSKILEDSNISKVQMLDLFILYAKLTVDTFEKNNPQEDTQLETARSHVQGLRSIQKVARLFKDPQDVETGNWAVDFYVIRAQFNMAKIARSIKQIAWLDHSIKALRDIIWTKHEISNTIEARVRKYQYGDGAQKNGVFPRPKDVVEKFLKEETAQMANQLSPLERLKSEILEHRLTGCPSKESLMDQRMLLRSLSLGKSTDLMGFNFARDENASKKLKESLPKNLRSNANELEKGLNRPSACWLKVWEEEFWNLEGKHRSALKTLIKEGQLETCLQRKERFLFTIIVDSKGKISDLQLTLGKNVKTGRKKKLDRCVRKKLKALRFPERELPVRTGGTKYRPSDGAIKLKISGFHPKSEIKLTR